ncbi:MAG: FemAB family PEP-CTERM system-associated protein [Myxococcales bacterium]|nr:FemAB family PEP-CTERM system-associated protein [Myxococcales bacterium]
MASQAFVVPTVRVARASDRARWNGYLSTHPAASVYHRWEWGEVFEASYATPYLPLMAMRDGRVSGVLPLVKLSGPITATQLVSMPYFGHGGALADDLESYRALLSAAEALRVETRARRVELRHAHALDPALTAAMPARDDKVLLRLALPESEEALLKQLGAKNRADIRRPEKEGMTAVVGGRALVPEFHAAYTAVMRDLGSPCHSARVFAEAAEVMHDRAFVVVVRYEGHPVGGGFVVGMGDTAEIPCAGSLHALSRLRGNMLLYWTVIRECIRRGYKTFSFGRSSADSGTFAFKKNWGAEPTPLAYHYLLGRGETLPTLRGDNPKVAKVVSAWQHLPLAVANQVGPRVVRWLP